MGMKGFYATTLKITACVLAVNSWWCMVCSNALLRASASETRPFTLIGAADTVLSWPDKPMMWTALAALRTHLALEKQPLLLDLQSSHSAVSEPWQHAGMRHLECTCGACSRLKCTRQVMYAPGAVYMQACYVHC